LESKIETIRNRAQKWLYISLGSVSLVLGIIGIPVPLLPTTPFLLLSAYCFAKGSDRLHRWLMEHPQLGPPIVQWQTYKAISRPAKWLGSLSMGFLVLLSLALEVPKWVLLLQGLVLVGVSVFLWTRREPPT
jgi:uncharacterized membrane protein YbaN (DUF454 family)